MKRFFTTPIGTIIFVVLMAIAFAILFSGCSEDADPAPAARVMNFTDDNTDARYHIDTDEFSLFLLGADSLTFTNIIPNPGKIGTFDFDAVEGSPGTFKNASLYHKGQQQQGISAGRLTITAFSDDFIEFAYTVTFRNGDRLEGLYRGQIRPIK